MVVVGLGGGQAPPTSPVLDWLVSGWLGGGGWFGRGGQAPPTSPVVDWLVSMWLKLQRQFKRSDLVYPKSLVPIKMCSDCETCGLLNNCK